MNLVQWSYDIISTMNSIYQGWFVPLYSWLEAMLLSTQNTTWNFFLSLCAQPKYVFVAGWNTIRYFICKYCKSELVRYRSFMRSHCSLNEMQRTTSNTVAFSIQSVGITCKWNTNTLTCLIAHFTNTNRLVDTQYTFVSFQTTSFRVLFSWSEVKFWSG